MSQKCPYCGWENGEELERCARCETDLEAGPSPAVEGDLEVRPEVPPILTGEIKPGLNARFATLIFLAYVAAQFIGSVVVGLVAFAFGWVDLRPGPGLHNPEASQRLMMLVALPTVLAGGAAVLLLSVQRLGRNLKDRSPTGAAWVLGTPRQLAGGFAVGVVLAFVYGTISSVFPPEKNMQMGPVARMAMTPGLQQAIWIGLALLFAPVIEECLFRGVMYGGYRQSLGPIWAAVLSVVLFWVLHLTEIFGYWPAMVGILMLASVALLFRLRASAVGPAVAVHTGYNSIIALGALLSSAGQ